MKLAIYAIAKNEEAFVERWFKSVEGADHVLLADTGSTDNTVKIAKELGIDVYELYIDPWRFDMARNTALSLLPADIDYCLALDLDEVLIGNWREDLEEQLANGVTRPRYKYIWSWKSEGVPDVSYYGDKIISRRGYRWRHPVHEVAYATGMTEVVGFSDGFRIEHHPDSTKSRGHYLPLLKLSVEEDPSNDRNSYYYARELFYYKHFDEAIKEFTRFLTMSGWDAERASAYRHMAKCTDDRNKKLDYLNLAIAESPRREAHMDLAFLYYGEQNWDGCLETVKKLLTIEHRPSDYISESIAWGEVPYDIGAVAAYHSGDKELSIEWTKKALEFLPEDERLLLNLKFLESE